MKMAMVFRLGPNPPIHLVPIAMTKTREPHTERVPAGSFWRGDDPFRNQSDDSNHAH